MARYLLLLACGMGFFTNGANGQDQKVVDSLMQILRMKSVGERYPELFRLAVEYVDNDNEKALEIIKQAEHEAFLSGDTLSIVKSVRAKGQILWRLGRFDDVIAAYEQIYPIAQTTNSLNEVMRMANTLGSVYILRGRFDKTLTYYLQAYSIAKSEKDSSSIGMVLNNIGITYYKLKDYKKGLYYLKQGFLIDRSLKEIEYDTPMNISLCYTNLLDFHNAKKYLDESIAICGADCPPRAMVHIKYALGCVSLGLNEFEKAEKEFLESYIVAKNLNDSRMQLDNIYLLAEIYTKRGQIENAIRYLDEGEKLIEGGISFNLEMIKIYSRFADLYLSLRNFEKASYYQTQYIELKDSIYDEALTLNLMRIEAEFLERENKEKIAEQDEIILLKEEIIRRQKIQSSIFFLLVLITLCCLIFLFMIYKQKQNVNILLEEKIRQRTSQLESNRDSLLKRIIEKDLRIKRASEVISTTISTVEGLCGTAVKDVTDRRAHLYLEMIGISIGSLSRSLESVFRTDISVKAKD